MTYPNYRALAGAVAFGVYDEQGTRVASISTAIGNQQGVAELLAAAPALARALLRLVHCAQVDVPHNHNGTGDAIDAACVALNQAGIIVSFPTE